VCTRKENFKGVDEWDGGEEVFKKGFDQIGLAVKKLELVEGILR
jgi:hypothetical protein